MNDIPQYDKKRASIELERQAEHRLQNPYAIRCAATLTEASPIPQDEDWATMYQSLKYGSTWRLVTAPEEGAVEEVVLSLQGIIYKKDLAPFNPKNFHEKPNAARFLRQSLTLCGLQTPIFQKSVGTVLEIHALLARSVDQDEMEQCSMVSFADDGDALLHMGNRYLTPKKETNGTITMPLTSDIDPHGHLARIAGPNFVYTDDNHVRYYDRRRVPGSEEMRFEECKPVIFRPGDVVEAQVTFIIVTLRDGKKKTSMVLRALSMLDGTVTQRSMVAQMLQRTDTPKVERHLKRRIGYEEEGTSKSQNENRETPEARPTIRRKVGYVHETISEATQRMSNMEIDNGACKSGDLD